MKIVDVSLETLKGGTLVEMFNKELAKVVTDIDDPNTEAEATRSITMTVTMKPDKNRARAETSIQCKSKLAPARAEDTTLYFGLEDGETTVTEVYQDQLPLDYKGDKKTADAGDNNKTTEADNVAPIRKNGEKK